LLKLSFSSDLIFLISSAFLVTSRFPSSISSCFSSKATSKQSISLDLSFNSNWKISCFSSKIVFNCLILFSLFTNSSSFVSITFCICCRSVWFFSRFHVVCSSSFLMFSNSVFFCSSSFCICLIFPSLKFISWSFLSKSCSFCCSSVWFFSRFHFVCSSSFLIFSNSLFLNSNSFSLSARVVCILFNSFTLPSRFLRLFSISLIVPSISPLILRNSSRSDRKSSSLFWISMFNMSIWLFFCSISILFSFNSSFVTCLSLSTKLNFLQVSWSLLLKFSKSSCFLSSSACIPTNSVWSLIIIIVPWVNPLPLNIGICSMSVKNLFPNWDSIEIDFTVTGFFFIVHSFNPSRNRSIPINLISEIFLPTTVPASICSISSAFLLNVVIMLSLSTIITGADIEFFILLKINSRFSFSVSKWPITFFLYSKSTVNCLFSSFLLSMICCLSSKSCCRWCIELLFSLRVISLLVSCVCISSIMLFLVSRCLLIVSISSCLSWTSIFNLLISSCFSSTSDWLLCSSFFVFSISSSLNFR